MDTVHVVDIVMVVGVVRVVLSHRLHVLSQKPGTSVSHKPFAKIDWHNDSSKVLDLILPQRRLCLIQGGIVVVVGVEVVVVNVVEVLVLVLVVLVEVDVLVLEVVDVDVVLVVVSHPLHVLSH